MQVLASLILTFLWFLSVGQCKFLPSYSFAKPKDMSNQSEFAVGTHWNYECLPGYIKRSFKITCLENFQWPDASQYCKREYSIIEAALGLLVYLCELTCYFFYSK